MFSKKIKIEPLCKNCRLFDGKKNLCQVVILHEGQKIHLPVTKQDTCFFENEFCAITDEGVKENFKVDVNEVKFWVEDPKTGQKTNGQGTVKIQYPKGFFGTEERLDI